MVDDLNIAKLNELFSKSESSNKELFAEMRTNVLMVAGKHYQAKSRNLLNRLRNSSVPEDTKVRLVKNHIHKIVNTYVNEIMSIAPGVRVIPHTTSELQDQKAAEIANAVWQDARHRYRMDEKIRGWVENFVSLGECAVKVFWDQSKGKVVGYEQATDEQGQPLFTDPTGADTTDSHSIHPTANDPVTGQSQMIPHEPKASNKPVMSGDFVIETILPFNLLHDPAAESMQESRYLIVRKMMDMVDAKLLAGDDEDKQRFIQESAQSTFKVFDANKADYVDSKNQVLIKEAFFRPCQQYPNGWYCLFTETGILVEQELPFGIFPIVWAGFQKIPTTARAHSIIRNLRPIQANINQLSSQQVQHQLTVGDDKLVTYGGGKVEKGGELAGIRWIKVSGQKPEVIPGRTGEQFLGAITAAIEELYEIANLADIKDDLSGNLDPNTLLFRSARHRKKFSLYATVIETFLKDLCALYLKLAQCYLPEDTLIKAVGKREAVNIAEFKDVKELDYAIKLDEVSDDIETTLGKSLQLQQILQYAGSDMPAETKAQIISQMPYVDEASSSEMMANVKNGDSMILRMDRGVQVQTRPGQNHAYFIKRLDSRMSMNDFELLSPQVQQLYEQKRQELQAMIAQEAQQLKQMQSEFIPTGGALIGVDVFTNVPNSTGGMKTTRSRVPYEAVQWLLKQLEAQGSSQEQMDSMNPSEQAGIAGQFLNQQASSGQSGLNGQMPQQPPNMSTPGQ